MNKIIVQKYCLILSDLFSIFCSYYLATEVVNHLNGIVTHKFNFHHWSWLKLLDVAMFIVFFWQKQLYFKRRPNWEEVRIIYKVLLIIALINIPVLFFKHLGATTNLTLFCTFWLLLLVLIPMFRSITKLTLFNMSVWQRNLYIVGVDENAVIGYELLTASNLLGYKVKGFIDLTNKTSKVLVSERNVPVIKLEELMRQNKHSEILVCLDGQNLASHLKLINSLQTYFLSVMILPQLDGLPLYGVEVNHFFGNEQLLLRLESNLSSRFNRIIKRIFDIVLSFILLPILLFLGLLISLLIFMEDRGSPFFIQKRIGKYGRLFGCVKFRTMHKDAEQILEQWRNHDDPIYLEYVANNYKLPMDPRVTKIGRFLRKTSLDELPQLINVIIGQMSLVGPRPLLSGELSDYTDGEFYYTQVSPGITGLWQISGRSKTLFTDRARLDSWYIKNWSLWYDVVILIKTVVVVIKSDGAY
jgi:undecaprenyl-phosphate galactose phosphotransferase